MELTIAVLLLLHGPVSSFDYLYTELERFGGSCYPWDSCSPTRPDDEDHLWGNHTCECGSHCIHYGTCCVDSPHVGKIPHVEHRGERCQRLSASFPESVVAVSRCSDKWRHEFQIQNKCEKPDPDTEDPLSAVSVTSLATLITYRNFFCALCNYDTRDTYIWDIALQFQTKESTPSLSNITNDYLLENLIYDKDERSWGVIAKNRLFYKIKVQFKVPPSIRKFVKKCYPNMVAQCDSSYAYNYELQYKCLSYYAPIILKSNGKSSPRKYRNIHCSLCNNVNASLSDSKMCNLDVGGRKATKPSFSFALLLDINTSDGDTVGQKENCGVNEKWDPFFKKCRSLACALPGYVVRDGKCVQS